MKFLSSLIFTLFIASSLAAQTVVYVSESKDNKIAVFSLDESTGDLTRTGAIALEGAPGCLAVSKDRTKLYAAIRSVSKFGTFSIDPKSGKLTAISTTPAAGSAAYIYPDKTEKWLLAAYYGEGQVSVSSITNGAIVGEPRQIIETGKRAHCILTDPTNKFAFTPHTMDLNKVEQFQFDPASGKLSANSPPYLAGAVGAGPRHMQFHPNGKWAYLVNEQSKSVTHCDFDAESGTLSRRETVSTHPHDWDISDGSCADIEISADGRFLYASNRGHDSIAIFAIHPESGELKALARAPTEQTPRSFNLIPGDEKYLVAAGQSSNKLVVYRRDTETGKLSRLKTVRCGQSPAWVLGVKLP